MSKREIYRRVAELHIANIDQGFLSSLGVGFLSLLYQAIDEGEDSVLLTVESDDRVVGFVAGSMGMGPVYRRMLRHAPRLALALLPSVLSPRRVWRIIEILRYSRGHAQASSWPRAELLSIALDPACRGRDMAAALYQRLAQFFQSKGVAEFKIVVGAALGPAHKFYQRMGAVPIAQTEVHQGERSTVYSGRSPELSR
ncbi:GNAT family N-acetyltransferase [Dyella silvatica]|uniref:GNAT family N-acetyltransferase n=1 Tax=Dyella silvatica TaxID=2992128 RepID=UPI002253429C|nr:GNAT family N-acetyltransferase [Dyella silvatica]